MGKIASYANWRVKGLIESTKRDYKNPNDLWTQKHCDVVQCVPPDGFSPGSRVNV